MGFWEVWVSCASCGLLGRCCSKHNQPDIDEPLLEEPCLAVPSRAAWGMVVGKPTLKNEFSSYSAQFLPSRCTLDRSCSYRPEITDGTSDPACSFRYCVLGADPPDVNTTVNSLVRKPTAEASNLEVNLSPGCWCPPMQDPSIVVACSPDYSYMRPFTSDTTKSNPPLVNDVSKDLKLLTAWNKSTKDSSINLTSKVKAPAGGPACTSPLISMQGGPNNGSPTRMKVQTKASPASVASTGSIAIKASPASVASTGSIAIKASPESVSSTGSIAIKASPASVTSTGPIAIKASPAPVTSTGPIAIKASLASVTSTGPIAIKRTHWEDPDVAYACSPPC